MATRRFEYSDDKSEKFWQISVDGDSYAVQFGRLGNKGQRQIKSFDSPQQAQSAAAKQIEKKIKKGYVEVSVAEEAASIDLPADFFSSERVSAAKDALGEILTTVDVSKPNRRLIFEYPWEGTFDGLFDDVSDLGQLNETINDYGCYMEDLGIAAVGLRELARLAGLELHLTVAGDDIEWDKPLLFVPGDLTIKGSVRARTNIVVTGDLSIEGLLENSTLMVAVAGNLRCASVLATGPLTIAGELVARSFLKLPSDEAACANVLRVEHLLVHPAIGPDANEVAAKQTTYLDSQEDCQKLVPDLLGDDGLVDRYKLQDALKKGAQLLR